MLIKKYINIIVNNHLFVAASAWISRGIFAVVQLISLPILINGLGSQHYAIFVILNSLTGWYMLFDCGISQSLQNYISEKRANNEEYADYIITAAMLLMLILIVSIGTIYLLAPYLGGLLLKSFMLSFSDKTHYFFISSVIFIITTTSSIVFKIWYGEHKGYLANILPAIASVISLGFIWVIIRETFPNKLFYCLLAYSMPSMLLNGIFCILKLRQNGFFYFNINYLLIKPIVFRAFRFFLFTLMGLLISQIDYIILSQTVSASEIVVYNIGTKIFNFLFSLYSAVLAAFLPACVELYIKKSYSEIRRQSILQILLGMTFILCGTVVFIVFKSDISRLISPQESINISIMFIAIMGIYFCIRVWTDTFATILISMNKFRRMFIVSIIHALLSVLLQSIFSYKIGINGIIIGLCISYLLTGVWGLPKIVYKSLNNPLEININRASPRVNGGMK